MRPSQLTWQTYLDSCAALGLLSACCCAGWAFQSQSCSGWSRPAWSSTAGPAAARWCPEGRTSESKSSLSGGFSAEEAGWMKGTLPLCPLACFLMSWMTRHGRKTLYLGLENKSSGTWRSSCAGSVSGSKCWTCFPNCQATRVFCLCSAFVYDLSSLNSGLLAFQLTLI